MAPELISMESTLGELYATPIGHDVVDKILLQLGKSKKLAANRFVSRIKVKTLARFAKRKLSPHFFETLIKLLNQETANNAPRDGKITHAWWKEAVFYQIYPRSFCDSNGDGVGDLQGIISKLDYLRDLGIDALWLSPIYDSPNDDNGYDIRDYRKILKAFGTMADFNKLLKEVHKRGMRIIMDLVVNHTSDEHAWFKEALGHQKSKYRNYYFIKKDDGTRTAPNNWTSFFSGSAWNYYEKERVWALHLFSPKQIDLNWDNKNVRRDIIEMINWWLDKGVDGFRMDVINYISKGKDLPNGDEAIGNLMGFTGIEQYFYGPHLHEYLRELHEKAFKAHNAFSVGETPGVGLEMARLLTGEERKEIDMLFAFDHLEMPGHVRWDDYEYDLNYYRDFIVEWLMQYGNNCRMSLFYNNHDNPRMTSKITSRTECRMPIQKLLAVMQFTLNGTPFVYQGDEMGLVNYAFASIDEITDVESKRYYAELLEKKSKAEAFNTILAGTREHARVLLPWNTFPRATSAHMIQTVDEEITETYRTLIAMRKNSDALIYGSFEVLDKRKNRFCYKRTGSDGEYIIDCNLGMSERTASFDGKGCELVYTSGSRGVDMQLYEARIWRKKDVIAASQE